MAADQQPSHTGKDVMKAWRSAEQQALSELGFRKADTDEYACTVDEADDWMGQLMLFKRAAGRGVATVRLDPVGFSLTHMPTEELLGRLTGSGPEAARHSTMVGSRTKVLPADLKRELDNLWLDDPARAPEVTAVVTAAVESKILPWMRANADVPRLLDALRVPQNNPGFEAKRLERLAALQFLLGDTSTAAAALRQFEDFCCDTGIPAVDGPSRQFLENFRAALRISPV
jgi:hypothetical protein